jgi:hypothetical protein
MRNPSLGLSGISALFLSLILAWPGFAYDYPLTSNAIRDAYFLGRRQGGISPELLKQYSRSVAELHQGNCTSEVRIDTPFLQIAESVSSLPNYSAQDAQKDFSGRTMALRIFLDICYMRQAPPPNSVKITFVQNKKEVLPDSDVRSTYAERFSETSFLLPNGERAKLEFDPRRLDSSTLTIRIDAPNGQHAETQFDMQSIR